MAVLSTLRSQVLRERLAQFSKVYASHRPAVQRVLNITFVAYVLGSTYLGLSSRSGKQQDSSSSRKGRGKSKQGEAGKPAKVAVSLSSQPYVVFMSLICPLNISCVQVDAVFYRRLGHILRIVIPGVRSKEALLLVMHSSLLIFRTAISLYVAALDGK
jgi:ATP-binding cassette subfamily D (ALD) long-chain fatty acid import protein